MSDRLIVLPAAKTSLEDALRSRDDLDVRRSVLREIAAVFDKIGQRPRRFPRAYAEVHRALTPQFRFAVFFEIIGDQEVVVMDVLHQRQDPARWPKP